VSELVGVRIRGESITKCRVMGGRERGLVCVYAWTRSRPCSEEGNQPARFALSEKEGYGLFDSGHSSGPDGLGSLFLIVSHVYELLYD